MKKLFTNIDTLYGAYYQNPGFIKGKEMANWPSLQNAWLLVENGFIVDFGDDNKPLPDADETVSLAGKCIMPGYADSHTHLVFAAWREDEFKDRLLGMTYQEIAARGGGILNSANKLKHMTEDELFYAAIERLSDLIRQGTTSIEIKSGYGLTLNQELKMLRVIARIKAEAPIPVKITLLGAHALPEEYKNNKPAFLEMVKNELLPQAVEQIGIDFFDAFCEDGYFSVEETLELMEAAAKLNVPSKIHVNQFKASGGVAAFVKVGALSLDHLEVMEDEDFDALTNASTIPVALPGCSHFLSIPYTPGRKMIDMGMGLALASDFNPGSSPSGNMNTVVSLACIKMKLLPEEAFISSTQNGAEAMQLGHLVGSITPGKIANFIVLKEGVKPGFIPYAFGHQHIDAVYVSGEVFV